MYFVCIVSNKSRKKHRESNRSITCVDYFHLHFEHFYARCTFRYIYREREHGKAFRDFNLRTYSQAGAGKYRYVLNKRRRGCVKRRWEQLDGERME